MRIIPLHRYRSSMLLCTLTLQFLHLQFNFDLILFLSVSSREVRFIHYVFFLFPPSYLPLSFCYLCPCRSCCLRLHYAVISWGSWIERINMSYRGCNDWTSTPSAPSDYPFCLLAPHTSNASIIPPVASLPSLLIPSLPFPSFPSLSFPSHPIPFHPILSLPSPAFTDAQAAVHRPEGPSAERITHVARTYAAALGLESRAR